MRILMVASEVAPYSKTGGLADVLGALPQALAAHGHEVEVVTPRYAEVTAGDRVGRITVRLGTRDLDAAVFATAQDRVRVVFIEHGGYFERAGLYGDGGQDYEDNPERFAFLAHAASRWAALTGARYDIVHGHDWQAGALAALVRGPQASGPLSQTPFVFTIHNLAYQGLFDPVWLPRVGLGPEVMRVDGMEFWRQASYLKAGIVYSDLITTVSPRYATEIQTPEYGCGLDGVLRGRRDRLVGILNGIDYDQWNPAGDAHLPAAFSAADVSGKAVAKRRLLERFGLSGTDGALDRPVVGLVSRLAEQKGFDLLEGLPAELPTLDAVFVLLGTGDARYEDSWRRMAAAFPGQVAVHIGFDESLAHLVEGGSDLFLMPSRYEPCGLNQMYSLRYGTVPIVRATGGLADTVRNFDEATGAGNGFTFDDYSAQALLGTLRWALQVYRRPETWRRLQLAGMREDHSWGASAKRYEEVYDRVRRP